MCAPAITRLATDPSSALRRADRPPAPTQRSAPTRSEVWRMQAASSGVVTLFGTVPECTSKLAAERAAERVAGVRALAKDLTVKLPGESLRSDSEIAEAALKAFSWDVQVPEKRLTLEVQNGFVTLKGEVNWYFQRKAAEENVRKLTGVVGVSNQITIKPNLTAKEVRSKI